MRKLEWVGQCYQLTPFVLLVFLGLNTQVAMAESKSQFQKSRVKISSTYCEKENFEQFLENFSEDLDFQYKHVAYPLKYISRDSADITDSFIVKKLSKSQFLAMKTFRYPNKEYRDEREISTKITKMAKNRREVLLWKEDTDIATSFFFSWNQCWFLNAVHAY